MAGVLAYLSAAIVAIWGVFHVVPTAAVVRGFGPISRDNRLIITQEWVVEALAMGLVAGIVVTTTALEGSNELSRWLYRITALALGVVAVWTAATGARTPVIWFKICVALLATTAALLLVASLL